MAVIPRNPNPNLGFRGNPDGQQGTKLVDYGVYAAPVHRALLRYGYRSYVLTYATDRDIRSSIDQGWPVVAWVTYNLVPEVPRLAWANGVQFFLVPREHAVLVIGYDAHSVYANDPFTKRFVRYDWRNFNRAWGYFTNMALVVEPCLMPLPVTRLHKVSASSTSVTWAWLPGANAYSYQVQLVQHGKRERTVFSGSQPDTQFTFSPVVPGATYEITVRSVSSCGGVSEPQKLWTYVPAPTPTPTPTPTSTEGGIQPTTTPTATASPTATSKP